MPILPKHSLEFAWVCHRTNFAGFPGGCQCDVNGPPCVCEDQIEAPYGQPDGGRKDRPFAALLAASQSEVHAHALESGEGL